LGRDEFTLGTDIDWTLLVDGISDPNHHALSDIEDQINAFAPKPVGREKTLRIENMDKRKPGGRTVQELTTLFEVFPRASFCFDIGHARQVDTSMVQAYRMLKVFAQRLRQIHVSEVSTQNKHATLSFVSILDYQEVAHLIPPRVPIIIESIVPEGQVGPEIKRVRRALAVS
jgi:hypothetical protein